MLILFYLPTIMYVPLLNIGESDADKEFLSSISPRMPKEALEDKPEFVDSLTQRLRCFVPDIEGIVSKA